MDGHRLIDMVCSFHYYCMHVIPDALTYKQSIKNKSIEVSSISSHYQKVDA